MRWRIEHDYRELKHGLGLDHFEGRTWRGWHHHVTLVTAAQAFLTLRRLAPKVHTPAWPSTRSSTLFRTCCTSGHGLQAADLPRASPRAPGAPSAAAIHPHMLCDRQAGERSRSGVRE